MSSSRLTSSSDRHPYAIGDEVWIDKIGPYSSVAGVPNSRPGRRETVLTVFWDGSDPYITVFINGGETPVACSRVCRVDAVTRLGELDGR